MKLNQAEIKEFFKLHKSLLFYTNQKMGIIKGIPSISKFKGPILNDVLKLRNIVCKDLSLIDTFVKQNPYNLSENELKVIENWKRGINATFIIVKYSKDYTIFYHSETQKCYGVLYVTSSQPPKGGGFQLRLQAHDVFLGSQYIL